MFGALDFMQGQVSGFFSVLDLAAQQGQATAASLVYPVAAQVMLSICVEWGEANFALILSH
jgi:hypothetical protein